MKINFFTMKFSLPLKFKIGSIDDSSGQQANYYRCIFMSFNVVLFLSRQTNADVIASTYSGNWPSRIIDLPTARRYSDGNLVISHQNHKNIFMNGISFQALPRLGLSFRYGGHGSGGGSHKVE